jgi:hypothetical protein
MVQRVRAFLVPTIICVCHLGTGVFSGDHGGYLSLNASAIPGPGHSLEHSHGTFYCFVCFAPSRRAVLALLSI